MFLHVSHKLTYSHHGGRQAVTVVAVPASTTKRSRYSKGDSWLRQLCY
jgi:hypothetical protein